MDTTPPPVNGTYGGLLGELLLTFDPGGPGVSLNWHAEVVHKHVAAIGSHQAVEQFAGTGVRYSPATGTWDGTGFEGDGVSTGQP